MKKLKTSIISSSARAPISNRTLDHIQESWSEIGEMLLKGVTSDTTGIIILHGCVPTVVGSSYAMTAGAAYYNGEFYSVPAFTTATAPGGQTAVWAIEETYRSGDPVEFKNSSGVSAGTQNFHLIRRLKWQFGASGSGIYDYNSSSVKTFKSLTDKIDDTYSLPEDTDFDTMLTSGFFYVNSSVNAPTGSENWHVIVNAINTNYALHIAHQLATNLIYYRRKSVDSGGWSDWKRFLNEDDYNTVLTSKADKAQGAWQTLSLASGVTGEILYRKNTINQLELYLSVTVPNGTSLIATLPSGFYATNRTLRFLSASSESTGVEARTLLISSSNGQITRVVTNEANIFLDTAVGLD
jgi:hypothetical protein